MRVLSLALSAVVVAAGCANRQPPAPVDPSVTNEDLGLRLTSVPADFVVDLNQGPDLELVPAEPSVGGRVTFSVGEEEQGINLIAAVNRHRSAIEEQPEAAYQGGQELLSPHGTAFYSRGRFLVGFDQVEETVVLLKHPTANRLLTIRYRYPAGADSSIRVQQLLDVLGVLEGTGGAPSPGAAEGDGS
jgi:hypothetical protein